MSATPPPTDVPPPDQEYQAPGGDDGNDAVETALARVDQSALASIARSDAMAQVDVAHSYPRQIKSFVKRSIELSTSNPETAKSCMYTLERTEFDPKKGKKVKKALVGPSVRLAEIVAHTFGNIRAGARPIDVGATTVTCQGMAWDMENNVQITTEVSRRITGKGGRRYGDDMIILTLNATCAIARRNAVFAVIPRSYVNEIFEHVKNVATGAGKPLGQRRDILVAALVKFGVGIDRILAKTERASVDDLSIEDMEILVGLGTRLREGEAVDTLFPLPQKEPSPVATSAQEGQRMDLGTPHAQAVPAAATKPPAPVVERPAEKKPAGAKVNFGDPDRAAAEPTAEEIAKYHGPGSEIS